MGDGRAHSMLLICLEWGGEPWTKTIRDRDACDRRVTSSRSDRAVNAPKIFETPPLLTLSAGWGWDLR
jgi:hypothetical protein